MRRSMLLAILVMACVHVCAAAVGPAPGKLVVSEGFKNPIGFYDATPTFSWKLAADGTVKAQTAYRVVAASSTTLLDDKADLWDSGKVASDQSVWIQYAGELLTSGQKVFWKVKFWEEKGTESAWSDVAHFELGLLRNSDWKGRWIRMSFEAAQKAKAEVEDKEKTTPKIVIKKALYGIRADATQQVDITERVAKLVASGKWVVLSGNTTAGSDPSPGTYKVTYVEYTADGKAMKQWVPENQQIDLATGEVKKPSRKKMHHIPEYFRKEFTLDNAVASARLYVTAKGIYEVYLNGRKVGKDFMAPGWTPYHARIETLTYDVTEMVKKGQNALGAILAEGWYAGPMMNKRFVYPQAKPALLLQLKTTFADGTETVVTTDKSWKVTNNGPIRFSSIYHGEEYASAMEMPGWNKVGFDDSDWINVVTDEVKPNPVLVPKRHYPVRITEKLPALKVTEPAPGNYVFDLGQNIVGWPILKVPAKKGGKIKVRVAEMLNKNGTLYTANYRGARSIDYYYASKDGEITWQPTFTFHGFRYVELSGLPEGVKPKADWVTGVVLHSDFPKTGSFTSSHKLLNKLQSNIIWGHRGNFLDIPTDCPQRNERLGWTGDAQVFCPTSFFNYDVLSFWMSWLQSVREDQKPSGYVCHVVPDTGCGQGSPGWGDVGVTGPWDVYVRTGHRRVLEENYDMMKKWIAAYEREAKGFITKRKGFGDWLQPYPVSRGRKADTPMEVIATAYFGRCAKIMESTATVLGKEADAKRYAKLFTDIQAAFSKTYFDENGRMTTKHKTQTGYLMALGYDLLPTEQRAGALAGFLERLDNAKGHLRTGFLGTPLIAPVLDRFGHIDKAYGVLFKETYPSWFYSIHQGATTMWERWNSYSHDKGFGNAGMNSFNHYAYGAIGQWMYERMAGLAPNPEEPGYKHFFIQPNPGGPLTHASAELETSYGKAASGWRKTDTGLVVNAVVPPNTTATFVVPQTGKAKPTVTLDGKVCALTSLDGQPVVDIGPGSYVFLVK